VVGDDGKRFQPGPRQLALLHDLAAENEGEVFAVRNAQWPSVAQRFTPLPRKRLQFLEQTRDVKPFSKRAAISFC
jgi:hypothetical protein